jgi:hypothetical protein
MSFRSGTYVAGLFALIMVLVSCHVEKRRHLRGFYIENFSGRGAFTQLNASNNEAVQHASAKSDMVLLNNDHITSDPWVFVETTIKPDDSIWIQTDVRSIPVRDTIRSSVPDTTQQVRTTSQITGISTLTGATFGMNQWALDAAVQSIAEATGTSLRLMPAVSVFGLSPLGMLLITSALVALIVFTVLMIQRRRTLRRNEQAPKP